MTFLFPFFSHLVVCMQGRGKGLQARILQMRQAVDGLDLWNHFNYTSQGPDMLLDDNLMDTEFLLGDLYNVQISSV